MRRVILAIWFCFGNYTCSESRIQALTALVLYCVRDLKNRPPKLSTPYSILVLFQIEHDYALPSPRKLKRRLETAVQKAEEFRRQKNNAEARAKRAKSTCALYLNDLRDKNLVNAELQTKLERYKGTDSILDEGDSEECTPKMTSLATYCDSGPILNSGVEIFARFHYRYSGRTFRKKFLLQRGTEVIRPRPPFVLAQGVRVFAPKTQLTQFKDVEKVSI